MVAIDAKYMRILQKIGDRVKDNFTRISGVASVLFLSYIVGSIMSSATVGLLSNLALKKVRSKPSPVSTPDVSKKLNYTTLRKDVVARNLFNSEGKVPDEKDPRGEKTESKSVFDATSSCAKSRLNIDLVGIIYATNPRSSYATVREKGVKVVDVYRSGESIIGNEQAVIYNITEDTIVINNDGTKECLKMKKPKGYKKPTAAASTSPNDSSDDGEREELSTIQLDSAYVQKELGPGFSKVLESGRLVPYHREGKMIGFKLIGVKSGSLWEKSGLKSGDVITDVNGTSMSQADKGFAFYESLQQDQKIRLEFLQKGKNPKTLNIEIK